MSMPIEGGRALLRGRVLGIPVHLDLTFVVVMALLGYRSGVTAVEFGLWLLITPIAVLVHELGHALVARTTGAQPQIALAGFGGVTTYSSPTEVSRLRSLAISLAGPGVGLARPAADPARPGGGCRARPGRLAGRGAVDRQFTCIVWSVFNLLPVLPLDGGQAMRELLPGTPAGTDPSRRDGVGRGRRPHDPAGLRVPAAVRGAVHAVLRRQQRAAVRQSSAAASSPGSSSPTAPVPVGGHRPVPRRRWSPGCGRGTPPAPVSC